jgi:hypothetical protein
MQSVCGHIRMSSPCTTIFSVGRWCVALRGCPVQAPLGRGFFSPPQTVGSWVWNSFRSEVEGAVELRFLRDARLGAILSCTDEEKGCDAEGEAMMAHLET